MEFYGSASGPELPLNRLGGLPGVIGFEVRLAPDTIAWPNEVDLDPLVLHCWITGRPISDFGGESMPD
jgi:hypothetical protein